MEKPVVGSPGAFETDENIQKVDIEELTPREIVEYLSQYIVGQEEAKRAVAIALRNRVRRMKLPENLRDEITPKNLLMIGPTGVGKTEISRRIARLINAPFIKVEATKYTEVGYVGRDVESIIKDLVNVAVAEEKSRAKKMVMNQARRNALEKLAMDFIRQKNLSEDRKYEIMQNIARGAYDEEEILVEVREGPSVDVIAASMIPGIEHVEEQIRSALSSILPGRVSKKRVKVKDALKILENRFADELINMEDITRRAIWRTENTGIVFIDEIDKLINPRGGHGPDVSGEGVQRDLLPIIEGTTVHTRYGTVRTDFILFVAAGAFHHAKPSELIPELQGRLPIRVELKPLTKSDFARILKFTDNSPTRHYQILLKTEELDVQFTDEALERIAEYAYMLNQTQENIGARRLYTIVENVMADISFDAPYLRGQKIVITAEYVDKKIAGLVKDENLANYIL